MAQILNLGKSGLKIISNFMGHTDAVHNKFYELPQDTLMLAKASKVLYAIERGIHKYKGMNLDEIQIDVEEEISEEQTHNEDGIEDEMNTAESTDPGDEENREEREDDEQKEEMTEDDSSEDEPEKKERPIKRKRSGKTVKPSTSNRGFRLRRRAE